MTDRTITIPANLWGGRQPRLLRRCADELEQSLGRNPAVADLIDLARRLADEIEKQAPREPGWYHVKSARSSQETVVWFDGHNYRDGSKFGSVRAVSANDTIRPVTIGGAS